MAGVNVRVYNLDENLNLQKDYQATSKKTYTR